jgi:hypothetical protein
MLQASPQAPASKNIDDAALLDDPAILEHEHSIGEVLNHAPVAREGRQGGAEPALKIGRQNKDLCLDADVQGRHRLVADDQSGLGGQSPGDRHVLALTTG